MTLKQLQDGMVKALKEGNKIEKDVLSSCIASVKKTAIDKGCRDSIDEELVNATLLKEQKILQEQIDTCPETHQTLKMEYEAKMKCLQEYVPKLITCKSSIRRMIIQLCDGIELKKENKGLIMKTIAPHFKGKVDMKVVQEVVNSYS